MSAIYFRGDNTEAFYRLLQRSNIHRFGQVLVHAGFPALLHILKEGIGGHGKDGNDPAQRVFAAADAAGGFIGRILKRIFGHNMNSGSLQKLETDKFARADQEGKLLYLDDDMKTEALPSTNVIKAIVTAEDEMDLEKKNKQSYQGLLVCRILAFGNGTLKSLFDRSQGFYRRQIILETKDVPPDRINDPYLADKMMEEVEGIVLWCIEGLERLIRNDYQFTISNKSQLLMNEMQEDDDNILSFLESTGYIGLEKGTYATSKDLYVAYCRWCNDNLDVPVSERSFARRFKERSVDYGMTYDKNISVGNGRHCRGFRGVHVKVRTKDVNY